MGRFLLVLILIYILGSCEKDPQIKDLREIIQPEKDSILNLVFNDPNKYELQILYTQIDRQPDGSIKFNTFPYNVDTLKYFYPASTVKMPVAFLALEKLNELQQQGIAVRAHSPLEIDSIRAPQKPVYIDSTGENGKATIAHYIHKLFTVSDNDAYNRLYEFVGQQAINEKLQKKGIFTNARILHRVGVGGFSSEENRHTNPFRFFDGDEVIYEQPGAIAPQMQYPPLKETFKGNSFINSNGAIVTEPFDFSEKSFISLPDLERSLRAIIFPETMGEATFNLTPEDYELLYKSMSIYPGESPGPIYEEPEYYDSYVKFLLFGDQKASIPDHIRIFNKVGLAYGYLTDCAYIVDFKNKIDFFLTATLLVNENGTFNDGIYEYDEVGIPFLAALGREIYQYELERKRTITPNLQKFIISYDTSSKYKQQHSAIQ